MQLGGGPHHQGLETRHLQEKEVYYQRNMWFLSWPGEEGDQQCIVRGLEGGTQDSKGSDWVRRMRTG